MMILTRYGYKDINDVNIGDELLAYDINDGHIIYNILEDKELWTPSMMENFQEVHGDFTFYEINGTYKLYKNQSVWANLRVIHASELQIGDVIYDDQDNDVTITSIIEVTDPSWWRLKVSGDHSYIADNITLHNASRYWVGGGSGINWSSISNTNWGSLSGTQDNASVPTSTDDTIFDGAGAAGNSQSRIASSATVLSMTILSGYTSTMTHNALLLIAGNLTLHNNYTIAGTSGIQITANSSINTGGKVWPNNMTFSTATFTLNSLLEIGGNLILAAGTSQTFAGTFGFKTSGMQFNQINAQTVTLKNGITYIVTNSMIGNVARIGADPLITSDDATIKAKLILLNGATCSLIVDLTRIDASGGRTINTFNGVVTDCINVRSYYDKQPIGIGN